MSRPTSLAKPCWIWEATQENLYNGDATNWWIPNSAALAALVRSAGLKRLSDSHIPRSLSPNRNFILAKWFTKNSFSLDTAKGAQSTRALALPQQIQLDLGECHPSLTSRMPTFALLSIVTSGFGTLVTAVVFSAF
jgi:hypothetical protein